MKRVFTKEQLQGCSRQNLLRKLDMVKSSNELTRKEMELNIAELEFALNGGVRHTSKEILEDIKAGEADISDLIQG